MNTKNSLLAIFICALLLTLLFYKQGIGLNLLIFETLLLVWLFVTKQIQLKNKLVLIASSAFVFTALCTVFINSIYSYLVHFLALFIFIGALNYPKVKSIVTAYLGAWVTTLLSIVTFLKQLTNTSVKGKKVTTRFKRWFMFLVPLLIIILFIVIYSNANAGFGAIVNNVLETIGNAWNSIFENLDWGAVFTYIFFIFVSIFLLVRCSFEVLENNDLKASTQLKRIRTKAITPFKTMSLKNELRAGVFLLVALNLLLLLVNFLDIKNVWFGFEWDGETLKEFVHEGTYLLILSILISIALVLYYFRKNLNFYSKNGLLKKLSYVWIIQNIILAISVGIRNFWYIEYYALAYKKIGVIFFLLATIYGLYTVLIKVKDKKSSFYLFKNNAMSVFLILVITSAVPWDICIAKYNFAHADESYIELEYLVDFSDKSLPYLDKPEQVVARLKANQNQKFLPDDDMKASNYFTRINYKKEAFKKKWENKKWLAWNWAEYRAYNMLFSNSE